MCFDVVNVPLSHEDGSVRGDGELMPLPLFYTWQDKFKAFIVNGLA